MRRAAALAAAFLAGALVSAAFAGADPRTEHLLGDQYQWQPAFPEVRRFPFRQDGVVCYVTSVGNITCEHPRIWKQVREDEP